MTATADGEVALTSESDVIDAEVVEELNAADARDLLDSIKVNLEDTRALVEQLYSGRGWLALGYESWAALVNAEIMGSMPRLDRAGRRELVGQLADTGMSTRAVGAVVGAGQGTVRRDLEAGAPNGAAGRTSRVTGTDGKSYAAAKPKGAAEYGTKSFVTEDGTVIEPSPDTLIEAKALTIDDPCLQGVLKALDATVETVRREADPTVVEGLRERLTAALAALDAASAKEAA